MFFLPSADFFFQSQHFKKKNLSGIPSECQTVPNCLQKISADDTRM